jgi:superfamily II DNA or RNA helicase
MQKLQPDDRLRAGDRVRVRGQPWRVGNVRTFGTCQLITLLGEGALNHSGRRQVLAPFDRVDPIDEVRRPRVVRMRAWRRRCRTLLADTRGAGTLQSPLHAKIDLLPHQLEPALAVVRGLGSRVLIADEVGLGKTIQAGLILAELKAMGAADRVLVLTPAGLREQWKGELLDRFGIDATLVDMAQARRQTASLPAGLNPWSTIPVVVTSVDYAKRPEVLPAILACHWDVIVVDEAHGVTPESDRHRAISTLAARASYLILLTATPHNGDRAAFEALCELGSTSGGTPDRLLAFRRQRRDVSLGLERRVHRVKVYSSPAERRMHDRLEEFSRALDAERHGDPAVALTLAMLHKRALSSARSLESSVMRRLEALPSAGANPVVQLALPLDEGGGELNTTDEAPGWIWPSLDSPERERHLLERVAEAARNAARQETKLAKLARLLKRLDARKESAIVFTEYRDTLAHVQRVLGRPCAVVHGGLSRAERRSALGNFSHGRHRVLLATDAAGEGLNLHQACRVVVNLELPWNPMRLEQRIGRVDRIGQTRRVHAFNLIAADTGECILFERLRARLARARQAIGAGDPLMPGAGDRIARLGATEAAATDLPVEPIPLLRLDAEARVEGQRLMAARSLIDGMASAVRIEGARPWIARTRATATRANLGARALVVLRLACEDLSGCPIAARLVPLLVPMTRPGVRCLADAFESMLHALECASFGIESTVIEEWLAEATQVAEAFWRQRLAREDSIVRVIKGASGHESQPGLFDGRAERARSARQQEAAEQISNAERRINAFLLRAVPAPARIRAALLLAH